MTEPTTETRDTTTFAQETAEPRRMHIALDTRNVAAASRFYEAFFNQPPAKRKPRYAKFTIDDPPLALALIETGKGAEGKGSGLYHLGIQVASSDAVAAAIKRLTVAGLAEKVERDVDCCYARQDKVWARDPDGNRWEVYALLGDADQLAPSASVGAAADIGAESDEACCAPGSCA